MVYRNKKLSVNDNSMKQQTKSTVFPDMPDTL